MLLIRARRLDLHRRLGFLGAGLAAVMVVLGSATALTLGYQDFLKSGAPPVFLSVQITDMLGRRLNDFHLCTQHSGQTAR